MTLSGLHYEFITYCLIALLCVTAAIGLYLYPKLVWRKDSPLREDGDLEIADGVRLHFEPLKTGAPIFPREEPTPRTSTLSGMAIGQTVLITTDHWFYAPDGKTYRAVFGTLRAVLPDSEVLGIKTNARSTNWYLEIGNMVIAGCQTHYAMLADRSEMNFGKVTQDYREGLTVQAVTQEANVYDADGLVDPEQGITRTLKEAVQ